MEEQDRNDIVKRMHLYGFAVDALRWDLLDEVFADGKLHIKHGARPAWTQREQLKLDLDGIHRGLQSSRHSITNVIVDISADVARSISYAEWRLSRSDRTYWIGEGWYEDDWTRTDSGWRVTKRLVNIAWAGGTIEHEAAAGASARLHGSALARRLYCCDRN